MTDRVVKARVTLPHQGFQRGESAEGNGPYLGDKREMSLLVQRTESGHVLVSVDSALQMIAEMESCTSRVAERKPVTCVCLRRAPSLRTARWYPPQARLPCRSVRKWRAVWLWPQWPSACVRAPRPLCAGSLAARALTGCGRGARVPGPGPAAAAQGRCEVRLSLPIPAPLGGLPQS